MNAANEIAVNAFLNDKISFTQIVEVAEKIVSTIPFLPKPSLNDLIETDTASRVKTKELTG